MLKHCRDCHFYIKNEDFEQYKELCTGNKLDQGMCAVSGREVNNVSNNLSRVHGIHPHICNVCQEKFVSYQSRDIHLRYDYSDAILVEIG